MRQAMRDARWLAASAALILGSAAFGKNVEGVKVPETATVEGKDLKLNGAGVRVKNVLFVGVNVYVAGLYLETPSNDPEKIISGDGIRRVSMTMLRDLDRKSMVDSVREGFEKNSRANMPVLKERLDRFLGEVKNDFKKGDSFVINYVPGKGTFLSGGGEKIVIEGKDFADALFSLWLGRQPVDENLKKALLGNG
jgi:hypothetical protein